MEERWGGEGTGGEGRGRGRHTKALSQRRKGKESEREAAARAVGCLALNNSALSLPGVPALQQAERAHC